MAKPEFEFFDVVTMLPWSQIEGEPKGVMEKILSRDPETGAYSRIVKFPPTETDKVKSHDFWEEVYILQGSMYDKTKKEQYVEGYYACRPPKMIHGPYSVPYGCILLETTYFDK